jgi:hypothetical protein
MLNVAIDVLCAVIVPLFFVAFGLVWIAFATYDLLKKK